MKYDLTHARYDRAHCLAPGLFRSLKRGDRKRLRLHVVYEYGDDRRIEFKGPEPLGVDDLRVLQGLVAMAGPSGLILSPEPKTEEGKQLRLVLDPKWEAVKQDALVVKGSYRTLAREIGYTNTRNYKPIRDCIERLWTVSIFAQSRNIRHGFHLLSAYTSEETDGKLYVALNPFIASAVLGDTPHARINMDEVRALKSDPARLIYQRLCGWIDLGKSGRAEMDTLCEYVWVEQCKPSTMRTRRAMVRKAMKELIETGWTVTEYVANKYEIKRPGQ